MVTVRGYQKSRTARTKHGLDRTSLAHTQHNRENQVPDSRVITVSPSTTDQKFVLVTGQRADHGSLKFVFRIPILPEAVEKNRGRSVIF